MKLIRSARALQRLVKEQRSAGLTVGLVPTMGALHQGHLDLVKRSASQCDVTIVSIFVNPLQFGKNEDLGSYPRRLKEDSILVEKHGASVVFAPNVHDMYEQNHQTYIYNNSVADLYCGAYRPGHFQGVLTVVAKLFLAAEPDRAYFGRKDYQQAWLIRKMVKDLNWNLRIVMVSTRRENDGLAMSSRNEYLSPEQRQSAVQVYQNLRQAKDDLQRGKSVSVVRKQIARKLKVVGADLQYFEVAERENLLAQKGKLKTDGKYVLLIAAYFGTTRLIDNLEI